MPYPALRRDFHLLDGMDNCRRRLYAWPIAPIRHDSPEFVFKPLGKTFAIMREFTMRLRKFHAKVLALTGPKTDIPAATRIIRVPCAMPGIFPPIPYSAPSQIFAALLAESNGLDPDRPRSLNIVTQMG